MLKLLSLDVWNTLIKLDLMYYGIARSLGSKGLGNADEFYEAIRRVHSKAKKFEVEGKLPKDEKIIHESLKLLSKELKVNTSELRKAIHQASIDVLQKDLVFDGVIDVLKEARELGLKIVLLGNVLFWDSRITKSLLRKVGITDFVDATYFADEVGVQKPDPRAFRKFLKDFKIKPCEAMHVGDSVTEDFGGALAAGLSATLISKNVENAICVGSRIFILPSFRFLNTVLHKLLTP